jgi:tRNA pseudouridine55 synthase
MLSGIFNIDKPPGATSFSVVSRVRKLTGIRKVGHAGTLDPMASGVLPVCLGRATRMVEFLLDQPKTYRGQVHFGVATDTYDADGEVTATADASALTKEAVASALEAFTGEIDQVPPMYSALKRHGRPLYEYARAGKDVELEARRVRVYRIELMSFDAPIAEIEVECGRGFYVRSLAHDLGQVLGCGAHLSKLTRTRSGPFSIEDAIALEDLESHAAHGSWEHRLLATDRAVEWMPAVILGKANTLETKHGRSIAFEGFTQPAGFDTNRAICRAYSDAGAFLALLEYQSLRAWKPRNVFDPA